MKLKFLFLLLILMPTLKMKAQVEIVSSGTGSAYILNVPAVFPLRSGVQVTFKANVVCTASPTIDVSATGPKSIRKEGGTVQLSAGDIQAGQVVNLVYDGVNWQMLSASGNPSSSGAVTGSGTMNYVSKWDNPSGTSLGNSSIFDNGTSVGIGTATPSSQFTLFGMADPLQMTVENQGGSFKTGYSIKTATNEWFLGQETAASGEFRIRHVTPNLVRFEINASGDVGIGTVLPGIIPGSTKYLTISSGIGVPVGSEAVSLELNGGDSGPGGVQNKIDFIARSTDGSNYNTGRIEMTNTSSSTNQGQMRFYTKNATSLTERMIINENGNVGVGTSVPGIIPGATTYLTISNPGNYSPTSVTSLELRGNVNAGSSPTAKIDFLNGITSSNNGRIEVQTSASSTADGAMLFYTNTGGTLSERLRITETGKVGIGITIPSEALHVNGNINFSGALMPNSIPGAPGQVLTSSGPGVAPQWANLTPGITGSGTTNYLARWTPSGTQLGTGLVYDDGSNVGIGTTTPSARLQVANFLGPSDVVNVSLVGGTVGSANIFMGNNTNNNLGAIRYDNSLNEMNFWTNNTANRFVINNNGNTSINGSPTTTDYLFVNRPTDFGANHTAIYAARSGGGGTPANGGTSWAPTGVDAVIKGYSNWGNNFTASIAGYNYQDYPNSASVVGADAGGGHLGALSLRDANNIQWGVYTTDQSYFGGNLGIALPAGTTPSTNLHVNGNARITGLVGPGTVVADANGNLGLVSGSAVTGSGTVNYVARWTPSGTQLGIGTLYDNGVNVGIGTTSPLNALSVHSNGFAKENIYTFINSSNSGGTLALGFARGTEAAKTQVLTGDALGALQFDGFTSAGAFQPGAWIKGSATENWTGTGTGAQLEFMTRANGTTNNTTRMTIANNGNVGVGAIPVNKLDIEGASVIGATYSGTNTAPSNGLLIEGQTGIGLTSGFQGKLHVFANTINSLGTYTNGVYGDVSGTAQSSRGTVGVSNATGIYGIGVYGYSQGAATNNYGVYGYATGGSSTNYAGYFDAGDVLINNNLGIGIAPSYKLHVALNTTGTLAYFDNNSTAGGTALNANLNAAASSAGVRYGLYSTAWYGTSSNYGVYAYGYGSGATSTDYGIYAIAGGVAGSTNYAGYFSGNTHIAGTLSKSGGAFKIDDPRDPENKYLMHSFVESPDMMNVYNGNITTGTDGTATVELPDYFQMLNKDFRYQLTVIGSFAQAIVFTEIADNKFIIKTDKPNIKVSWQVTGIRHDPWAEKNRIPNEIEKPANEKGTYLNPELYDQPKSKGLGYDSSKDPEKKK